MNSQIKKPFVNIGAITPFPSTEKIEKINKVFSHFRWEFQVEQNEDVIIFTLFFGNVNHSPQQIKNDGDYSLISFSDEWYECICTLCDISYNSVHKKTVCVHILQNLVGIKKYIDSILINPASSIDVIFDVGLYKKKKYDSKAFIELIIDVSLANINFGYIVKSKKHTSEVLDMISKRKVNLNNTQVLQRISYFWMFLTKYNLSIADFHNTKKVIELICLHHHEITNFLSIIYYDVHGSRRKFHKIEADTQKRLKVEIILNDEKIIARQQYLVYDHTDVFDKNKINIMVLDTIDPNKILIISENINECLSIINFEEMSYKTMKAFLHNFETIKDSIESERIINSVNVTSIDNLSETDWNFVVIINDLNIKKDFDNQKIIAVSIILNMGSEKYNIIEKNVYSWFKYFDEDLIKKLLNIIELGEVYENNKIIFNLNDQDSLFILEQQILEINKKKKVDVLINSNYISGGKKSKFGFRPKIISEKLFIDIELEGYTPREIDEIIEAYRNKLSLTKLKSGKIINFFNLDFEAFENELNYFNKKSNDLRGGSFITSTANIFFAATLPNQTNEIADFVKKFNNYKSTPNISKELKTFLKPYQLDGYLWMKKMLEFNFGCLLADDMGVGKTVQALSVIDDLIRYNPKVKILIVCPVTLMYNWEKEINERIGNVKVVQVEGRKENRETILTYSTASVFITSYTMVSKDNEYYKNFGISLMIIDEAQLIKNSDTQISKSIREVSCNNRIALSGTPIENNLGELWSIMDFLNPGILGEKKEFYNNYEKHIYNGDKKKAAVLKDIIKPFFLRRTKQEVLSDLPTKTEKILTIDFEIAEEEIYNSYLEYIRLEMKTQENPREKSTFLFKTILKLRQICCDSRLIGESIKESSKLKFLIQNIKEIITQDSKNKIIVFSQFTSMLDLIKLSLDNNKIKHQLLTGKTEKENRLKIVDTFNSDDSNVFLISLKAGGSGLNITSANYVFHYDPWWNIAAEMQATDRAHRIGQKKDVMVYKLIMKNSLEERIVTIQYKKHDLFKTFIDSSDNKMSVESLCDLIGI